MLGALTPAGAVVLLIGEPGSGKAFLAEQAARDLGARGGRNIATVMLPVPPHTEHGDESVFTAACAGVIHEDPAVTTELVLTALKFDVTQEEIVLVARGIDRYSARDLAVLQRLALIPHLRLLMTTGALSGAIYRIVQGQHATRVLLRPLTIEEADQHLSRLLGVERMDQTTLKKWHEISRGNSYALTVLAAASERAGTLRRGHGVAWAVSDEVLLSHELMSLVLEGCSEDETALLNLIALAEPVTEPELLRHMDAAALTALSRRGLVGSRPGARGAALTVTHALLGASIRAGMSPVLRAELTETIFNALIARAQLSDPLSDPERLRRLVSFGLEWGAELPARWIWAALESVTPGVQPEATLKLAYAFALHPGAEPAQAAVSLLRAENIARRIGDRARLRGVVEAMPKFIDAEGLDSVQRCRMRVSLIRRQLWDEGDIEAALRGLDTLEEEAASEAAMPGTDADIARDQLPVEAVRSSRVMVLAYGGRLAEAMRAAPPEDLSSDIGVEWVRASSRALIALIEAQRGRNTEASMRAEQSRMLGQIGSWSEFESVEMQGFCWLVGYWAEGDATGARRVLEQLEAEEIARDREETPRSDLLEIGRLLVDSLEGRWTEVARGASRLSDVLQQHDGFGVAPLAHALLGLAAAVLGEDDEARRSLVEAERPKPGIAQALGGTLRLLVLRARQWLYGGEVLDAARQLVVWARTEELPLIELNALHVIAFEAGEVTSELLVRARQLSAPLQQPVSSALAAHIEWIAQCPEDQDFEATAVPARATVAGSEEPELRLLADLGVWMPVPRAASPHLTPREREIALLAARGHTSRFIAERLQISTRTVETHLTRVFMKAGVENRDELWRWAAHERARRRTGRWGSRP